jgi:hypothetical protein
MVDFQKYAYEEVYRYYEFKRSDGKDGLATGETISTPAVTCKDATTGTDCSADMISNVSVVNSTQVVYKLKSGTVGSTYTVEVKALTSSGQKLEGKATIEII